MKSGKKFATKNSDQPNEKEKMVTDMVCGMTKPKSEMKEISEFLSKNYYFCSKENKGLFDARPDYYVSEDEREKARSETINI